LNKLLYRRSTRLGCCALALWTIEPLLISEVNGLPIFELLTIIFLSAFVVTSCRVTKRQSWSLISKQSPVVWLVGIAGICVSDFAYIYGAQFAPIAHIDLIDYLWPCFVIIFASLLPRERVSFHHFLGGICGLIGIYVLIGKELTAESLSSNYYIGYILALVGACLWAGYSAFSRHFHKVPTEMIGMYCGAGALISLILHLTLEQFIMPTWQEALLAAITGAASSGIAYQLWDHGVKYGNIYLLGALTYAARILAMVLLVAFGKEPLTLDLIVACILTSIGILICSLEQETIYKFLALFKKPFKNLFLRMNMMRP
jgi:drug/metabolite transporter (DMT)-like permease